MAYGNLGSLDNEETHKEIKRLAAYVDAQIAGGGALAANNTWSGINTFTAMPRWAVNAPVAGAGTNQATAAALNEGATVGTGANGTVGWRLPVGGIGSVVLFKGTTAGVANIYPDTGAAINAIAANGVYALPSGVIPVMLIKFTATQWYSFPLVAS